MLLSKSDLYIKMLQHDKISGLRCYYRCMASKWFTRVVMFSIWKIIISPSDSTIYRIVKRVFLKMLIKQFILSVDALLYAFTVLKNGIKLARSILYGFCGFKRYLHERNLFEFRINRPWNWGLVHFAYIIADIVSFRWWKLCSCWSKEQHNGI